jgi:hypothetical protein
MQTSQGLPGAKPQKKRAFHGDAKALAKNGTKSTRLNALSTAIRRSSDIVERELKILGNYTNERTATIQNNNNVYEGDTTNQAPIIENLANDGRIEELTQQLIPLLAQCQKDLDQNNSSFRAIGLACSEEGFVHLFEAGTRADPQLLALMRARLDFVGSSKKRKLVVKGEKHLLQCDINKKRRKSEDVECATNSNGSSGSDSSGSTSSSSDSSSSSSDRNSSNSISGGSSNSNGISSSSGGGSGSSSSGGGSSSSSSISSSP